jgi:hypothetical protein
VRPHSTPPFVAIFTLALGLAALPSTGAAQQARASIGSAGVGLPVAFTVAVRLNVAPAGPAVLVASGPEFDEYELPIRAAANIPWVLAVAAPDDGSGTALRSVRDARGSWVPLEAGTAVEVVPRSEPTNPVELRLRVRTLRGAGAGALARLRLEPGLADGG